MRYPLCVNPQRGQQKRCAGVRSVFSSRQSHTSLHELNGLEVVMEERVVLITGAGQRLGAATATRLMKEGCHVLIHVRSSVDEAQALLDLAAREHGESRGTLLVADLTVDEDLERLISEVQQHPLVRAHGLYGLVHNASFYSQGPFEETTLETYRSLNRLHMEAPYLLTQALLPAVERASGSVVAVVDTSWGRAWEGLAHYTSSKAGLRQLMLNLSGELAGRVRVNCLAPGAIMAADWEAEHFAKVLEKVPLGRSGQAEDIASGIHFLLSNGTITGNVLHVDGGWTLNE